MEQQQQYMCYWNEDYDNAPIVELKDSTFFSHERGYTTKDIENIKNLKVGETFGFNDLSGIHYITRVK